MENLDDLKKFEKNFNSGKDLDEKCRIIIDDQKILGKFIKAFEKFKIFGLEKIISAFDLDRNVLDCIKDLKIGLNAIDKVIEKGCLTEFSKRNIRFLAKLYDIDNPNNSFYLAFCLSHEIINEFKNSKIAFENE